MQGNTSKCVHHLTSFNFNSKLCYECQRLYYKSTKAIVNGKIKLDSFELLFPKLKTREFITAHRYH